MSTLEQLSLRLGYSFQAIGLLQLALTHRSAGSPNNERLEFLGDAVLGSVIAKALFDRFPQAKEGQLSRIRASLVRRETLAEIARELKLGDYLILGQGELKSGGHHRDSILADCVEGIIGAIQEDSDFSVAKTFILSLFTSRLEQADLGFAEKDAKTQLQEWLQSQQLALPLYSVLETTGDAHNRYFVVQCQIESHHVQIEGAGPSRRIAEQIAARDVLTHLKALKQLNEQAKI